MAMDEKGLGRRLQAMRVQAGLTQQALCQQAGLSYSTLTKIERGAIKAPSIFTIQSIAECLGIGLDDLLGSNPVRSVKKHRSKSGVSFVYFDINGCLVRFYHRAFTRLAEVSGAPADVIETAFWHYNDDVCRGDMTMEQFNKAFAETLGMDTVNWLDYYLETVEPIEEMHQLVHWAAKNYRIGLLSNTMPGFIETMRKHKLLPDLPYDSIIDSSVVQAIKPEAAIYDIATKKASCPASEILLIDDARTNLMAAERQGWHVLWFDDYNPEESITRVKDALELAA
jgi:FMN phosphatase YigB (HAD superfamily)/DNA-binding XRE family transcriptional regulator